MERKREKEWFDRPGGNVTVSDGELNDLNEKYPG
jgi:hypothetical protein